MLSILILGYKHEQFCEECLNSIVQQGLDNIEVIALDDGSPDGTYQKLLECSNNFPHPIKIMTQKNTGNVGLNCNLLLQQARGEFVMMQSVDDTYANGSIKPILDEMRANPHLKFIAGLDVNSPLKTIPFGKRTLQSLLALEKQGGSFFVQSAIWRKSILDAVGGYSPDLIGDDIVLRTKIFKHMLATKNNDFKFVPHEVFQYRIHPENLHKNRERQCKILREVLDAFFDGQTTYTMNLWLAQAILSYIKQGQLTKARQLFCNNKINKHPLQFSAFFTFHLFYKLFKGLTRPVRKYLKILK